MNSLANNVQRIGIKNVHSDIMSFNSQSKNERTRIEYIREIKEFFEYFHGKKLEQLSEIDISCKRNGEEFIQIDAIEYQNFLCDKGNSYATVNRKMSIIKNLFEFLQGNNYKVNYLAFKLKALKGNPKSYDSLTHKEALELSEHVKKYQHGEELESFILLAAITSARVSALLKVEWSKVKKARDGDYYIIKVLDKGNQLRDCSIPVSLFDKLKAIKKSNMLFNNLTANYLNYIIGKSVIALGFDPDRRIVTHSLRSTAPNYELDNGGSIKKAMDQSGHKSMNTFWKHYVEKKKDHATLAGMRMYEEVNEDVFESVSKERLLEVLKELNGDVYRQLALKVRNEV